MTETTGKKTGQDRWDRFLAVYPMTRAMRDMVFACPDLSYLSPADEPA